MIIENIEELRAVRFRIKDDKYGEYNDIIYYTEDEWKKTNPKERETHATDRVTNWRNKLDIDSAKEEIIVTEV